MLKVTTQKTGHKFSKAIKTILSNRNYLLSTSKIVLKTGFLV